MEKIKKTKDLDLLTKEEKERKARRRKLKKVLKNTNCKGNCGERSTKDVPWSTSQLRSVYLNLGYSLDKDYRKHLKTGKSKRSFFCKKLKKDKTFCKELKKILPGEKVKILRKLTTIKPIPINLPFNEYQERILKVYGRYMNNPQELINKCQVYTTSPYFDPKKAEETEEQGYDDIDPINYEDDPLEKVEGQKRKELIERLEKARKERGKGEELEEGVKELIFSKNQEFVSKFLIPQNKVKGLLLNASVGTGKTCSAVLTASSQFENQGWTILWVTRTTLKPAMYKNIFEDICHHRILRRLQKGKKVPKTKEGKQKLIKKNWMEPVSYRTFSNAMKGKFVNGEPVGNKLFKRLVSRNGSKDILQKTFLIFDEAHNIFAGDLKPQEEPDPSYIKAGIHASYAISGNYSCRVLLLTATPIINSPTDLSRMLNLLISKKEDQMPENLEDFKNKYIDPQTKEFTKEGIKSFVSSAKGLISVYDKSKDPGQFTQVVKHQVVFPASRFKLADFNYKEEIAKLKEEIKEKKKDCLVKKTKSREKSKECRENLKKYEKKKKENFKNIKKDISKDISQMTKLKECIVNK